MRQERTERLQTAIILAPVNLGLRPPSPGIEPGTIDAPEALVAAGLLEAIAPSETVTLPRSRYRFDPVSGSRIRNAPAIREMSLRLARNVEQVLREGGFPLVIGGDCSILLGSLLGARRIEPIGLLHIDGHADFFHPGNHEPGSHPGSVAGMDLALAVGLGEAVLTQWDDLDAPLVSPQRVIQIGDRARDAKPSTFPDLFDHGMTVFPIRQVLEEGVTSIWSSVVTSLDDRDIEQFWLHVDLDILDQTEFPAVDSPGSPGLTFDQLEALLQLTLNSTRCLGADITIYDPSFDPDRRYAAWIVAMLGRLFGPGTTS